MPPTEHLSSEVLEQLLTVGLPESEAIAVAQHLAECSECHCRADVLKFWRQFE